MGHRRWFNMTPAGVGENTPEASSADQKQVVDVYSVLRDHVAYAAAIRNEIRQVRREQKEQQQELAMKVSELSSKVDELISVATELKNRPSNSGGMSGGATGSVSAQPEDDPEVERLAHRIQDAIDVLRGDKSAGSSQLDGLQPSPTDVNAPVPSTPDPAALATDINSPQARDPNSPM